MEESSRLLLLLLVFLPQKASSLRRKGVVEIERDFMLASVGGSEEVEQEEEEEEKDVDGKGEDEEEEETKEEMLRRAFCGWQPRKAAMVLDKAAIAGILIRVKEKAF